MNRQILRLAIPNIISNLTVPLLSSVDTALVGHLEQVSYLGAIAVGGMIFNFIYWGFGFLRMGTTGLTAQAFGKQNKILSTLTLARALLVAAILGIIIITLQHIIIDASFMIVTATPDVEHNARIYFLIRILAAPATLSLYVFTGWFLGMQNARYPLILAVVTNCLNIGFNLLFIKVFKMHVNGVALGTVFANYLGLMVAIWLFIRMYRSHVQFFNLAEIVNWPELRKFFVVNRDIFIRTLALIFAFSFFTAKSSEAGEMILAANTILINLWTVMSYGIDGFAFAAESLIGRYFGAGDSKNLKRAVNYSFYWGVGLGLIFSLAYIWWPDQILNIFTDKDEVIALALQFAIWTMFAPVISSFCYIWDGIFIGATASVALRNAMLICLICFYLPAYYLFQNTLQNHALWLALTVFMLVRGISLTFLYRSQILAKAG